MYYLKCFYAFSLAWNLKFNMARECDYSISELNEDDRRKVEEIKAKLFGHERTDLSKVKKKSRNEKRKCERKSNRIWISYLGTDDSS